jgi:dTMP kinase
VSRGRFIVLEGLDGAGTTTQTARLVAALRAQGRFARGTREPSDGPIGTMIRQVLSGRFVLPGGRAPGWATMALLFAADRLDHVEAEIAPVLERGGVIVSDRYDASSLAYQSVTSSRDGAVDFIRTANAQALRPDVIVVVNVPADEAGRRRESRGEAAQLYEQSEVQRALAAFYTELPAHMPNDRVVLVDGVGTEDEVHARIVAAIEATCGWPEA